MTYTSQYPPAYNETYVKATTEHSTGYWAYQATNPSNSLTGTNAGTGWLGTASTPQRFHIDLGEAKIIKRIYYENYHESGTYTTRGANAVTFWGSNKSSAFNELTYGTDTNWTQLTLDTANFTAHVASDQADPHYSVVTNTTAYRYYALKIASDFGGGYIGLRRIELQTEDGSEENYSGVSVGPMVMIE